MKKYLIVLAAAVVALASCNKGGGGNKYTSLKFQESEVTLALGQESKLYLAWEPTSLEAPVCKWTSSDAEVVLVDQNGNVKAVSAGDAYITATLGEGESALKASCHVLVKSIYDLLAWSEMGVFDIDRKSPIGEPYEVQTSKGTKYTVQKYPALWYLWDENILFVNGEGFSGAGFFAEIETPIELITTGEHAGALWTTDILFTDASPADSAGVCPAGALTDAEEWLKFITDTTYKGDGSFKGAPIHYVDFNNEEQVSFLGFIKNGWIGEYYYSAEEIYYYYQMNITWLGGAYGLVWDEAAKDFAQPAKFAERNDQFYQFIPSNDAAAPAKAARNIMRVNEKVVLNKDLKKNAMKVFSLTKKQ